MSRWLKKKIKITVLVLGFKLSPSFILGTKGLDPQRFIFLKPIRLPWMFNESEVPRYSHKSWQVKFLICSGAQF